MDNGEPSSIDHLRPLFDQYHYDIGLLASIIVMQALKPCNTRQSVANMIEAAGRINPLYETSVVRGVVEALRGDGDADQESRGP